MSISVSRGADTDRSTLIRQNLKQDLAPTSQSLSLFPTVWDVILTKRLLNNLPLPLELIEFVMDLAEYWPSATTRMKDSVAVLSDETLKAMEFYSIMFTYHHWVKEYRKGKELLYTGALASRGSLTAGNSWRPKAKNRVSDLLEEKGASPSILLPARGKRPCRRIVFDIISREDCKGPKIEEPSTWFEATLDTPERDHNLRESKPIITGSASPSIDSGNSTATQEPTRPRTAVFRSMQSVWHRPGYAAKGLATKKKNVESSRRNETSPILVAHNESSTRLNQHLQVIWNYDDPDSKTEKDGLSQGAKFVRSMEVGDSIVLYARSGSASRNAPQCMNYVASACVTIYWAV